MGPRLGRVILRDKAFAERVTAAVRAVEARTAAELVVVAAPRSGSYRDLALLGGLIAAGLALLIVLWSPLEFPPLWIPLEIGAVTLLVIGALRDRAAPIRALTTSARRARQVQEAASLAFLGEAVHATRDRTGLLVYLSEAERRVALVPDLGLQAAVAPGRWNAVRWGPGPDPSEVKDLEGFLAGLAAVGEILASALPPKNDDPQELPDAPRVYT